MALSRRDLLRAVAAAAATGAVAPACRGARPTAAGDANAGAARFAPLMTVQLQLASAQPIGHVPRGTRTTFPIAGGTFSGARVRGTVVPCGSEWTLARSDDVVELEMRLVLATDAGDHIDLTLRGLHAAPGHVRTTARFATSAATHAYLNQLLAVGEARLRDATHVHTLEALL
jgi:hypothetical protein